MGGDGGRDYERDYRGGGNDSRERNRGGGRRDQQRNDNNAHDDHAAEANFGDMETETKITVLNDMCGAIIGKGGQRIREIRQGSGAHIETSGSEKGSKEPRVITIRGTQRQIVVAQQMMAESVQNRGSS